MYIVVDFAANHPTDKSSFKKNMNASRPSEHPPVRGENVKTFRWGHRLQVQKLFPVAADLMQDWPLPYTVSGLLFTT